MAAILRTGKKTMRGFGSKLMTLILIGLLIYGIWQISILRKEVASLRTEVAQLKIISTAKPASASSLNEIKSHVELAKDFAVKGNFEKARSELHNSLDGLENTADNIQNLLEKIGAEPKETKGSKGK
jgi:prefoldin subunit 5